MSKDNRLGGPKQRYEAHRATYRDDPALPPWEELHPGVQAAWGQSLAEENVPAATAARANYHYDHLGRGPTNQKPPSLHGAPWLHTQDEGTRQRLPDDAEARKAIPLATGVLDYFPDALAAVAETSRAGNDKHNPGEPLHWDRTKSTDEADCLLRHFVDRGKIDSDGIRHSAKVAWRALALLQKEIEDEKAALAAGG